MELIELELLDRNGTLKDLFQGKTFVSFGI
jgi:hypothetical protein